ncbi:MAG: hemolysin III family protein [Dysgonomonas sp.]|nr:hemolysin III family protein [Dysgonomonas sp.]
MAKKINYTANEELANSISHGIGILLGIVGGYILLEISILSGNNWAIFSVAVYLAGMLASYITSTLYHSCKKEIKKENLRKCDHAAIYLHIAGTYTPFTLVVLREQGFWGWGLFIIVWLAAVIGVILSFKKLKKHSNIETICFVLMGCVILTALKPLSDVLSATGKIESLYWLIGGGVSYILGALFYSWTKKEYMHTIFHIFVLGGSVCHMLAIYLIL